MFSFNKNPYEFILNEIQYSGHTPEEKETLEYFLLVAFDISNDGDLFFLKNFYKLYMGVFDRLDIDKVNEFKMRVNEVIAITNLIEISLKFIRTLELLSLGFSLSEFDSDKVRWVKEGEYETPINYRQFRRKVSTKEIEVILDYYYFPNKDYTEYIAYPKWVFLKDEQYLSNPYRRAWEHYYAFHWNGVGSLEDKLYESPKALPVNHTPHSWLRKNQLFLLEKQNGK